jgi:phage tail-like protein
MTTSAPGTLQDYLPAIYQDNPFLGQFLSAFAEILLGNDRTQNSAQKGLEQTIDQMADIFNPIKLAAGEVFPQNNEKNLEFLTWLSDWTAFSLRADLNLTQQGEFIANILPLYRRRGTKTNLQQLLKIFMLAEPTIEETSNLALQIGKQSTIGKDTFVGGEAPHFFRVTVVLPETLQQDLKGLARQLEIASALIELEKPAHTHYQLIPIFPGTIQIGHTSTVGVNTLLGTIPQPTAKASPPESPK